MTALPRQSVAPHIATEHLSNGYWKATLTIAAHAGMPEYVQSNDAFHDEQEARDWAEWMADFILTPVED